MITLASLTKKIPKATFIHHQSEQQQPKEDLEEKILNPGLFRIYIKKK